jgi:glycosyltransferase involved in cell wall biosynthesis
VARILYIDHYAGSIHHGMEFRPYYFARRWLEMGHQVSIVAASFAHVRQSNPQVARPLERESIDGIDYWWLRTPRYSGNGARRAINIFAFVLALLRRAREISREVRPDAVIASSTYPIDIFPAYRIARICSARLIFELHDLWPLSPIELGGMSRWHPFVMLMAAGERFACRNSDDVVSILPLAREHLVQRGMPPHKFTHVPNGIVLEDWLKSAASIPAGMRASIDECRRQGDLVAIYAGAHGPANNLDVFIEAAAQLRDAPLVLCFVGDGPEKKELARRAESAGLTRVKFLDSVPKAAIPDLLGMADCLLFSLAPSPLFRFGISPNKLMDYMMSGKPIVAAVTAGNDLITDAGCGLCVPAGDAKALADALRRIVRFSPAERAALGARGRRAVEENYSYNVLADRFARVLSVTRAAKAK